MITYESDLFGVNLLARVHGSAVYKNVLPALFSTGILLIIEYTHSRPFREDRIVEHPYGVGAFIGFFSFLLAFRLNFAYQRYWEACTSVHQMLSKWTDTGIVTAAFSYQAEQFDDIKPPAFGSYPHLESARLKGRARAYKATLEETMEQIQDAAQVQADLDAQQKHYWWHGMRKRRKATSQSASTKVEEGTKTFHSGRDGQRGNVDDTSIPVPQRFQQQFTKGGIRGGRSKSKRDLLVKQSRGSLHLSMDRESKVPLPSLFLQETLHLVSLLSAVAMSTLRNDIESTASPLTEYLPGKPFPAVDPDALALDVREQYGNDSTFWRWAYYCLGLSRSERHRTLYNAARPFGVLGGVSDREVELLQQARGPYAKVSLCTMWLQEFLSREYMAGSTGGVAPPIISRLYQFISDGMVGYNQARKVAYVPFPFPHGQITAFFSLTIILIFPFLYYAYVDSSLSFACVINFFTVLCFLGVHEVCKGLGPALVTRFATSQSNNASFAFLSLPRLHENWRIRFRMCQTTFH